MCACTGWAGAASINALDTTVLQSSTRSAARCFEKIVRAEGGRCTHLPCGVNEGLRCSAAAAAWPESASNVPIDVTEDGKLRSQYASAVSTIRVARQAASAVLASVDPCTAPQKQAEPGQASSRLGSHHCRQTRCMRALPPALCSWQAELAAADACTPTLFVLAARTILDVPAHASDTCRSRCHSRGRHRRRPCMAAS